MIIDKMRTLQHLTLQEKSVVEYILANPECIFTMNASELARASYTSPSTLIRLCQKLETKGYSDFKVIYVSEYPKMMKLKYALLDEPFSKETAIEDIIEVIPLLYSKGCDYTKSNLDCNVIIRCVNYIKQFKKVDIYGVGLNYDIANMICYKLADLGIDAHAFNCAHWEYIKLNELENKKPLNILISHTGKNPVVVDIAERLKKCHQKTLSISGALEDKRLSQLCDEEICIMTAPTTSSFSNTFFSISTMYVLDVLMASLLCAKYDEIKKVERVMAGERQSWQNKK